MPIVIRDTPRLATSVITIGSGPHSGRFVREGRCP
jgi:hypothetical protein